jgi:hypothetical protein
MKSIRMSVAVSVVCAGMAWAQAPAKSHVMLRPADVQWMAGPPNLPKGAELVVLSGDPGKAGPFAIRLRFPAGYKIAPHWHPTDEHVTVISGIFSMGMGEKFDASTTQDLPSGGYAVMPAQMRHFAWTKHGAVVQVHGVGPFALTYVNASDDPATAK